jgi:hypothetical protein
MPNRYPVVTIEKWQEAPHYDIVVLINERRTYVKILHILKKAPMQAPKIIDVQAATNQVTTIDLTKGVSRQARGGHFCPTRFSLVKVAGSGGGTVC